MVTKYIQHNGLRVILEPVDSAASISAGLWINRGSRHERAEEYGYAHFVEHMLFKGTEKYSARELARIVDRVGGQHNAATNREYTCYYINVISDHIELALEILSDMYYHPLFDKDELEKEKNVILEEIMMYEDTPDELVHDLFIESMMKGHPLSHSILGTTTTIRDATSESLRNFYSANYCNDNAIFVLSGKFDEQAVKDLIKKYFEKENSGAASASLVETVSPGRIARNHAERDLEQMHFCMGAEGLKRNDPDRWSLYILSTILGGSMSSRLFQKVREERGLCYSIYSFHSSFSDHGVFGIYCATANSNFRTALDLIMEECRSLSRKGITAEELQDAKTFMKGNLALNMESIEVRMGQLAKNEITFGRHFTFNEIREQIDSVTMDDFMSLVSRLFDNKRLSLISVGRMSPDPEDSPDLGV